MSLNYSGSSSKQYMTSKNSFIQSRVLNDDDRQMRRRMNSYIERNVVSNMTCAALINMHCFLSKFFSL